MTEHTYAMIKPGYEDLWGVVVQRIIDEGLDIVRMKVMQFDDKLASVFYAEHVGKGFYPELAGYMTSGPIVALELAGDSAIKKWREIIGPTKKEVAVEQSPNSLRALYARSTTENLCHGSDSQESADREIGIIFADEIAEEKNKTNIGQATNALNNVIGNSDQPKAEEQNTKEEQKNKSKCCLLI